MTEESGDPEGSEGLWEGKPWGKVGVGGESRLSGLSDKPGAQGVDSGGREGHRPPAEERLGCGKGRHQEPSLLTSLHLPPTLIVHKVAWGSEVPSPPTISRDRDWQGLRLHPNLIALAWVSCPALVQSAKARVRWSHTWGTGGKGGRKELANSANREKSHRSRK